MTCINKGELSACPFAFSELSERVQNYGCLPEPHAVVKMRVQYGKTWACHEEPTKPCIGAIQFLKANNLPYDVVDSNLVTERDDWSQYLTP